MSHPLVLLIFLKVFLSLWWTSQLPLAERFDEIHHYQYAHFITSHARLPTSADILPDYDGEMWVFNQYNQPPLTYLLASPLVAWLDRGEMDFPVPNPAPNCAEIPTQKFFQPFGGQTARAMWALRFQQVFLGAVATALMWRAAGAFSPALAMPATTLFVTFPPLLEMGSYFNNDFLLVVLGAAMLAWLYEQRLFWLSMTFVLAIFSKLTALIWLPVVLVFWAYHLGKWGLLLVVLVLGLYFTWNQLQCDKPICRTYNDLNLERVEINLHGWVRYDRAFSNLMLTAVFPPSNEVLQPSRFLHGLIWAILGLGLFLAVRSLCQSALLWFIVGASLGMVIVRVWWLQSPYAHIRYMSSALPALCLLLAFGYARLGSPWKYLPVFFTLPMAFFAPALYLTPLYPMPERIHDLPPQARLENAILFESGLQVVGWFEQTAYLQAAHPITEPLYLFVEFWTPRGWEKTCGYTAGTAWYPSPRWQAGEIILHPVPQIPSDVQQIAFFSYHFTDENLYFNRYNVDDEDQPIGNNFIVIPNMER